MARRIVTTLALVVGLSAFASPIQASDATFPIGLWLSDSAAGGGGQYGLSVQSLAALRWQGINVGTAGGSVRKCQNKLARYDSLGYRIWLAADTFHWSNPNVTPPVHNLDIAGRDDLFTDTMDQYFISHGYSNPTPLFYYSKSSFDTYLNNMVSSVVDSVKNCHALWKYFYWDEPNNEHSIYADTTWKEFWENIWWGPDRTCSRTDSLGVHSWLKWKIEHRDTLHTVCINLGGAYQNKAAFSLLNANYCNTQGQIFANKMQGVSYDTWPFSWSIPIGDTTALRTAWTDVADTMVAVGKRTNPTDPVPVYDTQLQHCGDLRPNSQYPTRDSSRITIPEEVREEANLAILHEIKGILYFLLPSKPEAAPQPRDQIVWAEFWDENYVPFDAPYEDYVYNRNHPGYTSPDSLRPFSDPNSQLRDPFRYPLPPKPRTDSCAKSWEYYYKWRYAPYARNWNFLKTINDPIHIIAPHLRNIWKVGQRITSVVPDSAVSANPEYVTFSDSIYSPSSRAYYVFIVSKDFYSPQRKYTVTVHGLPNPPGGDQYYVLDLNSRHVIPYTGSIVFYTILKPGEGRLFRFIIGPSNPGGAAMPLTTPAPNPYNGSMWNTLLVTDPDISFHKAGQTAPNVQFTEGDTVVLSATVYNLGFGNQTDSVKFYLGDPLAGGTFLGGSSVTVPGLSTSDTLPKTVTVTYNLVTNYTTPLGPYDINVILKGATSSAHSLLWLNAEDYATKINGSPWDMDESKPYQDIATYSGFANLTDSISSCWEGSTVTPPPPTPTLHFRLASSIDASKYKTMQFRIFSDKAESVQVSWSPQQPGSVPGMTYLPGLPQGWKVITIPLGTYGGWGGSVTDFFLNFPFTAGMNNRKIRLAWAKLTTR